jgi:hypothetical protein
MEEILFVNQLTIKKKINFNNQFIYLFILLVFISDTMGP